MYEAIRDVWAGMIVEGGSRQRLLDAHPLHLYYGSSASSKALFFLVTPEKPSIPELSSDVKVERGQRHDGSWTVVLTLQDPALTQTFMTLCIELARHSMAATSESAALRLFFESLQQWRALLRSLQSRLSGEQIRGLVAELWFGLNYISTHLTVEEMLSSWQGPFGSPQDFVLPTGELFEVKSVHTGARTVEISSPEQLDPVAENPLALVLVTVDECDATVCDAETLASLDVKLRSRLGQGSQSVEKLDQRLAAIGFDPMDDHYGEQYFHISAVRFYTVTGEFPRVRRLHVPDSVDQLSYRLRLAGILGYHVAVPPSILWLPTTEQTNE